MKWFDNLKILQKIICVVAVIYFFMIVLVLNVYNYTTEKSEKIFSEYRNANLSEIYSYDMALNMRTNEANILNSANSKNEDEKKRYLSEIAKVYNKVLIVQAKYKNLPLDEQEIKYFNQYLTNFNKYTKVRLKTIELVKQGKADKAVTYFLSNKSLLNKTINDLETLRNYEKNKQQKIAIQSKENINQLLKRIMLIMLFCYILAILFGLLMSQRILSSLSKVLKKIKLVQSGDLDVAKIEVKSHDEFGEISSEIDCMAKNIENFIEREQFFGKIILTSVSSFNIQEILSAIVTETGKYFDVDRCFFLEIDEQKNKYKSIKDYELYRSLNDMKSAEPFAVSEEKMNFINEQLKEKDKIVAIENVDEAGLFFDENDISYKYRPKSLMAVPVVHLDKFLGFLIVESVEEYKKFTKQDIEFFKLIGNQSAIILNQIKLYNTLQKAKEKESQLRNLISKIVLTENIEQAVSVTVKEIQSIFDSDIVAFKFYDPNYNNFLIPKAAYSKNAEFLQNFQEVIKSIPRQKTVNEFIARHTFENKDILIGEDIKNSEYPMEVKAYAKQMNVNSGVIVPIFYKESPFAIICLLNESSEKSFSEEDIDFIRLMIPLISACLSMFQLNEKLKKLSHIEAKLCKMMLEIRNLEDHDTIFNYLLAELIDIFKADGAFHVCKNLNNNLYRLSTVEKEKIFSKEFGDLFLKEFQDVECEKAILINNVNEEIKDNRLKKYCNDNNIASFILYPLLFRKIKEDCSKLMCLNVVCSSTAENWSSDDANAFSHIMDVVNIVYLEILQRIELHETRKNFITTLTHDLRSPLMGVQKAVEVMIISKPEKPIGAYSEFLKNIHSTNDELLKLIDDLLSVYHYESGKIEFKLEANNIEGLVHESVMMLKHLASAKSCEITDEVEAELPSVMIDRNEIKRVLVNLIGNSIKHTREGTKIHIKTIKSGQELIVSVNDNGEGISDEDKSKIFDKYQTKTRKVGAGLGLYLSKQIVEAHKGKIWFETEVGVGTTFYFSIPL